MRKFTKRKTSIITVDTFFPLQTFSSYIPVDADIIAFVVCVCCGEFSKAKINSL